MEMKYDKTHKIGNTTIHVVSPETTLGRKMTQEEKDSILQECARVNLELLTKLKLQAQAKEA